MTEAKASASTEPASNPVPPEQQQSLEDIEGVVADSEEKGYLGETPDYDRDAYTLRTGPESPSTLEATLEAKRAELDAQLDEAKERGKERAAGAKSKASSRASDAKAGHEERKTARGGNN